MCVIANIFRGDKSFQNAFLGMLIMGVIYLIAWAVAGRQKYKSSRVMVTMPPDGFSPTTLRYIWKAGLDNPQNYRGLLAAIVHMSMNRFVSVRERNGDFTFVMEGSNASLLPVEERVIVDTLFTEGNSIDVGGDPNRSIFQATVATLAGELEVLYKRKYVEPNVRFSCVTLIPIVLVLICTFWSLNQEGIDILLFATAVFVLSVITFSTMVNFAYTIIERRRRDRSQPKVRIADRFRIVYRLILIAIVGGLAAWVYRLTNLPFHSILYIPPLLIIGLMYHLANNVIAILTPEGADMMEKIEQFRHYLSSGAASRSVEDLDRYLPYALALEVEYEWAGQFRRVKTAAPDWFDLSSFIIQSPSDLVSILSGQLYEAISSAAAASGRPSY